MAGKYLGISNIIVAAIISGILYAYCKVANIFIFDSIAIECVLMEYMTLGKRVNKYLAYEWWLTHVLWYTYVNCVDSILLYRHNLNATKNI